MVELGCQATHVGLTSIYVLQLVVTMHFSWEYHLLDDNDSHPQASCYRRLLPSASRTDGKRDALAEHQAIYV